MTIARIIRVSVYKIVCQKWTVQLEVNIREYFKHVEACKINMVNKSTVVINTEHCAVTEQMYLVQVSGILHVLGHIFLLDVRIKLASILTMYVS
jgi:hypothetical protein